MMNGVLGIVGAIIGGTVGYFIFYLLLSQGFYAMILPGALLGIGCSLASRIRSFGLGAVSGVLALVLGIFTEWHFFPFIDDDSLSYFVTHLYELKSATLVMIGIGAASGLWFGIGRNAGIRSVKSR